MFHNNLGVQQSDVVVNRTTVLIKRIFFVKMMLKVLILDTITTLYRCCAERDFTVHR